jgi:hypothetical protein
MRNFNFDIKDIEIKILYVFRLKKLCTLNIE